MAQRRQRSARRNSGQSKPASAISQISVYVKKAEVTLENAELVVRRLKRMARATTTEWDDALEAERALLRMRTAFAELCRSRTDEDVKLAVRGIKVTSDTILEAAARQSEAIRELFLRAAAQASTK